MEALIIDDHELVRSGIASLLAGTGRFAAMAQARTLTDAKRIIEEAAQSSPPKMPALVFLDVQLGEENGLDFIPFLKKTCRAKRLKAPPVLICSVYEDPFLMRLALETGAAGYVPKSRGNDELLRAANAALAGRTYVPEAHDEKLIEIADVHDLLTMREKTALALLRQGKNNRQIAQAMGIGKHSAETIVSNIYMKTGVANREGLMAL